MSLRNPFNEMMNEDIKRFDAIHSEGTKESIERNLSKLALFTNPFKILSQEQVKLPEAAAERIRLNVLRNISPSIALGEMVGSYLNGYIESFAGFNSTILNNIIEDLRLVSGKTIGTLSVKIYELLAAHRLTTGEQVSLLDVDGIFDAYKPIELTFSISLNGDTVKDQLPQQLISLFQRVGVKEFRISKIERADRGIALTLALPNENGAHLMNNFELADFADLKLIEMQLAKNTTEEIFPIPFEREIKQVIADIEALLDLGRLEEALSKGIDFLSAKRLLHPQSHAFRLQGNYAYVNNNRSNLSHATIAMEEDIITQSLRKLLNNLS